MDIGHTNSYSSSELAAIPPFFLPYPAPSPSPSPTPSPTPTPTPPSLQANAGARAHLRAHTDICAQTVHVSCSVILLVDMCLGVGLLNHMVLLGLVPSGTSILFSIVALPTHIPTNGGGEFPFLHILSSICYLQTFP